MRRQDQILDAALVVALGVGLVLAARLVLADPGVAYVPVMAATDSTQAMQAPGGPERALAVKLARVGDYLTVEDLARGVLAIQQGRLQGAQPLTADELAKVKARIAIADEHRRALLEAEAALASAEADQDAIARQIAATLTPEQKAWVLAQRDNVSVGGVEAAYWQELATALNAPVAP